ncbi:coiled-coil domain-containing protein 190 [Erethizon dorsatum]
MLPQDKENLELGDLEDAEENSPPKAAKEMWPGQHSDFRLVTSRTPWIISVSLSSPVVSQDDTQEPSSSKKTLTVISSDGNKGMKRGLFCCSAIVKRMHMNVARGPLHKHFDFERKNAKQAEVRLGQRLQKLEEVCLYHVKLLSREQRQLQKELQRLQQADIIKKRFSSYLGNENQKKPDVLMFPPQARQKHKLPESNVSSFPRALATSTTQERYKTKSLMPPVYCTGLRDPKKSKEYRRSQSYRIYCIREEKSQAQEKDSVKTPKGVDPDNGTSAPCQDREVSTNTVEPGPGSNPPGESGMVPEDATRSKDSNLKPGGNAGKQLLPNSMEWAISFQGESTKSTFLELFGKAKNAHYLRHRVPPESERLLSIGEIFGHGDSSLSGAEKDCETRVPPKFLFNID